VALRILVADDHTVVRRGVIDILAEGFPGAEFGEADNGQQVLQLVRKQKWDVVVLDIVLPGRSGLEVLKDIKSSRPELPVIVLSVHPEEHYARRTLRAGAASYLTKNAALGELVQAVRKVLAGGRYVTASVAEALASELNGSAPRAPHELLSDREYEVLCLFASGKTAAQVACELSLSIKTVGTYHARVLRKLGLKSNADLVRYAVENRLVT